MNALDFPTWYQSMVRVCKDKKKISKGLQDDQGKTIGKDRAPRSKGSKF